MNKGVRAATGDIIGFLNVDDSYPEGMLTKVGTAFAANPNVHILVGDTVVFEDAGPGRRTIRFVFNHPHGIWLADACSAIRESTAVSSVAECSTRSDCSTTSTTFVPTAISLPVRHWPTWRPFH